MDDLGVVIQILDLIRKGHRFRDINLTYPPVTENGIRYDKAMAGYFHMPWLHAPAFLDLYGKAAAIEAGHYQGMEAAPRAYVILKAAETAMGLSGGDFVECGVYRGGTALLASEAIAMAGDAGKPGFHLFDTFAGIPPTCLTPAEASSGMAGKYADASLEAVRANLAKYADFLFFHPGCVPESFDGFDAAAVRYLHIDINTAAAHAACLEFFGPKLVDGAVVIFDDYGWPRHSDAKRAVDDYFSRNGLPLPTALMTGQGYYIHSRAGRGLLPF